MRYAKRGMRGTGTRRVNSTVVQKKRKATKVSKLRLNPVVRKLVDRRIRGSQEKHHREREWANNSGITAVSGQITRTNGYYTELTPEVAVGDNADNREGNELTLNSFKIEFNVRTQLEGPQYYRIIVATSRQYKNQDVLATDVTRGNELCNSLLRVNGSAVDFNGTMTRLYDKVNRENFIVHYDKVFKINNPAQVVGAGGYTVPIYVKQHVIYLKCKGRKLRYSVASDVNPNNWSPCLFVGTADPFNPTSNSTRTIEVYGQTKMTFIG